MQKLKEGRVYKKKLKTGLPRRTQPSQPVLSRSYGPILPTSLIYRMLSTRGVYPQTPRAVMGT